MAEVALYTRDTGITLSNWQERIDRLQGDQGWLQYQVNSKNLSKTKILAKLTIYANVQEWTPNFEKIDKIISIYYSNILFYSGFDFTLNDPCGVLHPKGALQLKFIVQKEKATKEIIVWIIGWLRNWI